MTLFYPKPAEALASYQEQQLQLKRLQYVPLPEIWRTLKKQLAAVAEPSQLEGSQVAAEALAAMGPELCPGPEDFSSPRASRPTAAPAKPLQRRCM